MRTGSTAKRVGNKRGFGGELRAEIVEAAERLLAEHASSEAVTLRAIAREAGIAAPSIYPHFSDRDAILDEVVERGFERLAEIGAAAVASAPAGIQAVRALAAAYVGFAREYPGQYRVLFERASSNIAAPPHPYREGVKAFDVLIEAMRDTKAGSASADDALVRDAQTLFASLHGIAVLRSSLPGFPWQDEAALVDNAVSRICGEPPSSR